MNDFDFAPAAPSPEILLHTVHITWVNGVDNEHSTRVAEALNGYAITVPGLFFYRTGPDLALQKNTADFGIVALFENRASYQAYAVDDGHQAIIAELIAPSAHARNSAQIAFTR